MGAVNSTGGRLKRLLGSGVARIWVFIAAVAVVSVAIWAYDLGSFGPLGTEGIRLPWWALVIVFALTEVFVVHVHFRRQTHTLSASEIGLVLGLFLASPAGLVAGQVVGSGLVLSLHRRQKPVKLAFNLVEMSLCNGLALLIFRSALEANGRGAHAWAIALVAAGVAHTVGVLLVSAAISVAEGRLSVSHLPSTLLVSLVGALAAASLALLAVELLRLDSLAEILVVMPLVACGLAFRGYMAQREQREHVEFLYESMRETHGAPEFGLAIGQLLVAVRRLLRANYAEIILLSPSPGEPALRSVSDLAGEVLMHPEALTREDELALAYAGAADRALLLPRRRNVHPLDETLRSRGLGDAIVGALRSEQRVFGLLLVGGRVSDVSTFSPEDLALFETFGGHASVLLKNGRLERSLAQVTELKEELLHQAYHDALTGLPNRLMFSEKVAETLAGGADDGTKHAVLFLDLDRFKVVNDSWGHAAGDELLTQVAARIRSSIRAEDVPARLGGDEFAVLLPRVDAAGAESSAKRLADVISAPFLLSSGQQVTVRASIGIAVTDPDMATADELLRSADIAMYSAKAGQGRSALYDPALHGRLRRRHELALELGRAVDQGEFVVHYQPVISLVDGTIQAFEALARWQHPERGLLPPAEFLGLVEESGLSFEFGASIRDQAFRCATNWPDVLPEAASFGLWVNVAPSEFTNERLVEDVAMALTRTHLDARNLTIEITESSVMQDEHGALRAMQRLRELGVRLSLDDFGTGYSSLTRLKDFPIELLKIPKPFVDPLLADDADTRFVDAILRLARSLGLVAVAEGIEYAEQARKLRDLGCGIGQGFLFSRPIPEHEVFRLLRESSLQGFGARLPATRGPGIGPQQPLAIDAVR